MKRSLSFILILGAVFEIGLRCFGFLQSPLYVRSNEYEYIYAPNQHVKRFNNEIITNEYSMRSLPLKKDDAIRILVLGDSVINGGNQITHKELATSLLEERLSKEFKLNIRVLNASAGSWGIDNAAAYVLKYGTFNSKMIILVFNSHDAHDIMTHQNIVGVDKNYPDKQYPLAIFELLDRYIIPRIIPVENKTADNDSYNPGWQFFFDYSKAHNIPLLIVLHAEKAEVSRASYNENGQWILKEAQKNNIPVISDLDNISEKQYIDNIHLNKDGQKLLSDLIYPYVQEFIKR